VVLERTQLDKDTLIREWKEVHEKYGTSEYVFAIEKLPSLRKRYALREIRKIEDEAFKASQKARQSAAKLFPGVLETLSSLKEEKECVIVGFTESKAYYAGQRIRELGLDGIIKYLYSSEHTEMPATEQRRLQRPPYNLYELRKTKVRYTPKGIAKPDPIILQTILQDLGADREETLYIGDKLDRDITMAQSAGVIDVHASYGEAKDRPEYELLRKVTHWTQEAVERERETGVTEASPSCTISNFGELEKRFKFARFVEPRRDLTKEDKTAVVEAWKKTIDVQQHFNDLEMRIRNFALTMIVAILGTIGISSTQTAHSPQFFWYASLLTLSGIGVWGAFYFMDRRWYHRLLHGAVRHGEYIEQSCRLQLPELQLTKTVSLMSPSRHWGRVFHSDNKLDLFYGSIAIGLFAIFLVFLLSALDVPLDSCTSMKAWTALAIVIITVAVSWFRKRDLV
jgi:HAD superfamily hydrolase (TIGR01549 family)